MKLTPQFKVKCHALLNTDQYVKCIIDKFYPMGLYKSF